MASLPPVPIREPMYDTNGGIAPAWAAWFRQLFLRVGGSEAESADTVATDLENHIISTHAHTAINIQNSPIGGLVATNVQSALNEHQADIDQINADLLDLDGASAYEVAVENGFVGSQSAWLASLVGAQGPTGPIGLTGSQGSAGVQGPQGPPGGAVNTSFAVNCFDGYIYTSSVGGHAYILEFA